MARTFFLSRPAALASGAALALFAFISAPVHAAPQVVVSIVPIHSLAAGVMEGIGEPTLLVPVGASPHTYALKPSDARALQSSDLVIWIGKQFENYLEKPLASLAGKARTLQIANFDGLKLYEVREGGPFEGHDAGHNHGHSHSHGKKSAAKKGPAPDHEDDMHLWLDPDNAKAIVAAIAKELAAIDPPNAARYQTNAEAMDTRLTRLDDSIKARVASVRERPYIVFHDAYQYFEKRYGTAIVGSITVSPEHKPSAKRVSELRNRLKVTGATCVFREPQFPAPIVDTLVSGTGVKIGVLDPEGADLTPGRDAYFTLMDRIADSLATCLAPAS